MLKDSLKYALTSMRQRKLRSWLTIVGIIIGVASIVALIGISQGMQNYIEEEFESFGTNVIIIRPGTILAQPSPGEEGLTDSDVRFVERISGVDDVIPMIYDTAEVEFHRQTIQTSVWGIKADDLKKFMKQSDYGFIDGGFFNTDNANDIVIGYLAATEIFDDELHVRNNILIEDQKFRIVGILEEIGNQQDDTMIMLPLDKARDVLNQTDEISMMMVYAKSGVDVEKLNEKIKDKLEDYRGEEDFISITAVQLIEQISGILGVISLIVAGIASISLLVGAIGIMNTMYTSVLERTREIGIMKAIGATNARILGIFLIESGLIGIVGGIIGVALGSAIALAVGYISPSLNLGFALVIRIKPVMIISGILFAFILGAVSGFFPARSAAKLKPATALQWE